MADTLLLPEIVEETAIEEPWSVLLWDDPVNTMEFVARVLSKVFGYDAEKARSVMLAAHENGKTAAWSGEREKAEGFCRELHGWGLQASLEKDRT